ncbi:hypothetical protein ACHAXN_009210 [Cyclotella atomus]
MSGWEELWKDDTTTVDDTSDNNNKTSNETNPFPNDDSSTSNPPSITPSPTRITNPTLFSPIFSPTNHYSSREDFNEFFNTSQLLAMNLTLSPASPTSTPSFAPTSSAIHNQGGYNWGSQTPDYNNNNNPTSEEAVNFKEFIAFVSWYAFLVLCCFIPTLCAYQRRRRNARILQASLNNMQRRLDELDRMGGLERIMVHSTNDPTNINTDGTQRYSTEMLDLGENRNRDWEFLEQLFGTGTTNNNGADENNGGYSDRRRSLLSEIWSGMSVRMLVEREERRKRERGSRLVAALKESSMEVKEWHLIPNEPVNEPLSPINALKQNDEHIIDIRDGMDKKPEGKEVHLESTELPKSEPNVEAVVEETGTNSSCAKPQQPNTTIPLSLYQVDDPYIDDDDDNPYSALCIPCTDETNNKSTSSPPSSPQSPPQTESRLVPPTCAICLLNYEPGCYVSWSSNCIHVFHRDCILMWLLKKEEPLCPCCRQEFVSVSGGLSVVGTHTVPWEELLAG